MSDKKVLICLLVFRIVLIVLMVLVVPGEAERGRMGK
jgi:hypothetical protein